MANELNEGGSMFVKVMTDEQMEVLRKQIAVYATICEQLVELHKSLTAQNDLSGSRLGSLYCDPLLTSNSHKISGRQRWSPTPMQLQILERIFNQGVNNPGKVKVPEITAELLQHGQVTETNVYNWFQNRRARSKRKQQAAPVNNDNNNINNNVNNNNNNNTESEVETEDELLYVDHKKKQDEDVQNLDVIRSGADDLGSHEPGASSGVQYLVDSNVGNKPDTVLFQEGINKIGDSFEHVSFYGGLDDQLLSKMEVPGDYDSYLQQDEYNISG